MKRLFLGAVVACAIALAGSLITIASGGHTSIGSYWTGVAVGAWAWAIASGRELLA